MQNTPGFDRLSQEVLLIFNSKISSFIFKLDEEARGVSTELADLRESKLSLCIRKVLEASANSEEWISEKKRGCEVRSLAQLLEVTCTSIESLYQFLYYAIDRLQTVIAGRLYDYSDLEIAILLLELYRMDEEESDSEIPGKVLDFNDQDNPPLNASALHPHDLLKYLISDVVTARVFKVHGAEIYKKWAQA